jgi:hypothetical protein
MPINQGCKSLSAVSKLIHSDFLSSKPCWLYFSLWKSYIILRSIFPGQCFLTTEQQVFNSEFVIRKLFAYFCNWKKKCYSLIPTSYLQNCVCLFLLSNKEIKEFKLDFLFAKLRLPFLLFNKKKTTVRFRIPFPKFVCQLYLH